MALHKLSPNQRQPPSFPKPSPSLATMDIIHSAASLVLSSTFAFLGSVISGICWLLGLLVSAIGWYFYLCSPKLHFLFSLVTRVVRSIFSFFNSAALYTASIALEFPISTVLLAVVTVTLYCVLWPGEPKPARYRPVSRAGYGRDKYLRPEYLGRRRGEDSEDVLAGIAARGI